MRTYRLIKEMWGTVAGESHRVITSLPRGAVLNLVGPAENAPSEIEILWEGKSVRVFEQDFNERTEEATEPSQMASVAAVGQRGAAPGTARVAEPPTTVPSVGRKPDQPEQKDQNAPRVRRFNAAGRELF